MFGCSSNNQMDSTLVIIPNQSALLDSTKAVELVSTCSRYSPQIEGSWNPSGKQIKKMESQLYKIGEIISDNCCFTGEQVGNVNYFYRQYVGVIIEDQKYIYINAFPSGEFENWPKEIEKPDWKVEPYGVCDGGPSFWGILYDPNSNKFSNLAFNGI